VSGACFEITTQMKMSFRGNNMYIENNLGIHATHATHATLLGRLRQRRTGKSGDIQDCCAPIPATEPESTEELSRHSVAPLSDASTVPADDPTEDEPCPYSREQLAAFSVSHPHLRCCPSTTPRWWWLERAWCESNCKNPCELQVKNSEVVQ